MTRKSIGKLSIHHIFINEFYLFILLITNFRKIKNVMVHDGIKIYFKIENSKFKDFNIRITCLIPRIYEDKDKADMEGPMYTEHITHPASEFDNYYGQSLYMKVEHFWEYGLYDEFILDMYIKVLFSIFVKFDTLVKKNNGY